TKWPTFAPPQWQVITPPLTRLALASETDQPYDKISNAMVIDAGVMKNPFTSYIGPHGTTFGALFAKIAGPIFGYLSLTNPIINSWWAVLKSLI
ncbi:MAG: hypothetical protein ABJQ14_13260, partial [Hyphomicrobiales bacterium]